MSKWLGIVGIGEDGLDALAPVARAMVESAEVLVGGARHLAMVPEDGRERLTWSTPLSRVVDDVTRRRGQRVCVLATGDPMCFGVGVTLAKHVPIGELTIIPAPSAFGMACARLGWPLAEVETLTLHGRPLDLVHLYINPGARLLILANDGDTPAQVAATLSRLGYGNSRLVVLEHMGGAAERTVEGRANTWAGRAADFHTLAVECVAGAGAVVRPRVPGLPDEAFANDGQLTKREVRAVTLAALAPLPRALLWDVGAGAGSVAIEWMRAGGDAIAIEGDALRARTIADNAAALGVPNLRIVTGAAPAALEGFDPPDAVFVGGGLTSEGLLEACWRALKPAGRLVANAVTLEGEQVLAEWRARVGGELTRIALSRAGPIGGHTAWRPMLPITQWTAHKP